MKYAVPSQEVTDIAKISCQKPLPKIYIITNTINVNGTETSLKKCSDNGEYDVIVIDTSTIKTVKFAVSSGNRCMVNTIEFYK